MRLIKGDKTDISGIEIISIHIPKTGGRSFHEILKQVYGQSLDQRFEKHHFFPDKDKDDTVIVKLPDGIKGIHGHLNIKQVKHIIDKDNPKVITWVRNPVDRVISNYYYFMKRIREGDTPERQQDKISYSLLEYAAQPKRRNRISMILEGIDLKDFFFIGVMEQFDHDIQILSNLMGWPQDMGVPHINDSSSFKHNNDCTTQYDDIDEAMRMTLANLNDADMLLYAEIKKMRGIR